MGFLSDVLSNWEDLRGLWTCPNPGGWKIGSHRVSPLPIIFDRFYEYYGDAEAISALIQQLLPADAHQYKGEPPTSDTTSAVVHMDVGGPAQVGMPAPEGIGYATTTNPLLTDGRQHRSKSAVARAKLRSTSAKRKRGEAGRNQWRELQQVAESLGFERCLINDNEGFEHLDEGIRLELRPNGEVSIWYRPEDIPNRFHSRDAPDTICGHVAYEALLTGKWRQRTDSLQFTQADLKRVLESWSLEQGAGRVLKEDTRAAYQQLVQQFDTGQVSLPLAAELRLHGNDIISAAGVKVLGARTVGGEEWARLVVMDPGHECTINHLLSSPLPPHGIPLFEPGHVSAHSYSVLRQRLQRVIVPVVQDLILMVGLPTAEDDLVAAQVNGISPQKPFSISELQRSREPIPATRVPHVSVLCEGTCAADVHRTMESPITSEGNSKLQALGQVTRVLEGLVQVLVGVFFQVLQTIMSCFWRISQSWQTLVTYMYEGYVSMCQMWYGLAAYWQDHGERGMFGQGLLGIATSPASGTRQGHSGYRECRVAEGSESFVSDAWMSPAVVSSVVNVESGVYTLACRVHCGFGCDKSGSVAYVPTWVEETCDETWIGRELSTDLVQVQCLVWEGRVADSRPVVQRCDDCVLHVCVYIDEVLRVVIARVWSIVYRGILTTHVEVGVLAQSYKVLSAWDGSFGVKCAAETSMHREVAYAEYTNEAFERCDDGPVENVAYCCVKAGEGEGLHNEVVLAQINLMVWQVVCIELKLTQVGVGVPTQSYWEYRAYDETRWEGSVVGNSRSVKPRCGVNVPMLNGALECSTNGVTVWVVSAVIGRVNAAESVSAEYSVTGDCTALDTGECNIIEAVTSWCPVGGIVLAHQTLTLNLGPIAGYAEAGATYLKPCVEGKLLRSVWELTSELRESWTQVAHRYTEYNVGCFPSAPTGSEVIVIVLNEARKSSHIGVSVLSVSKFQDGNICGVLEYVEYSSLVVTGRTTQFCRASLGELFASTRLAVICCGSDNNSLFTGSSQGESSRSGTRSFWWPVFGNFMYPQTSVYVWAPLAGSAAVGAINMTFASVVTREAESIGHLKLSMRIITKYLSSQQRTNPWSKGNDSWESQHNILARNKGDGENRSVWCYTEDQDEHNTRADIDSKRKWHRPEKESWIDDICQEILVSIWCWMELMSRWQVRFPSPLTLLVLLLCAVPMKSDGSQCLQGYAYRCSIQEVVHHFGKGYTADDMGDGPVRLNLELAPVHNLDEMLRTMDPQSPDSNWVDLVMDSNRVRWTASIEGYSWRDRTPPDGFCSFNAVMQGYDAFHGIPPEGPYGRKDGSTIQRIRDLIRLMGDTSNVPPLYVFGSKENAIETLRRMYHVLCTNAPSTRANWGNAANIEWWAAALDIPISFCRQQSRSIWALNEDDCVSSTLPELIELCSTSRVWLQILPVHFAHCMSGRLVPELELGNLIQQAVYKLRTYRAMLPSLTEQPSVRRTDTGGEATGRDLPDTYEGSGPAARRISNSHLRGQEVQRQRCTRSRRTGVRVLMDENNSTWGRTSNELGVALPRDYELTGALPAFPPSPYHIGGGHRLQVALASDGRSGLSLYLHTEGPCAVPPLGVVTDYTGQGTLTGEIPPGYLDQDAPIPPQARAQGAYLIRYMAKMGPQLVDASPSCYAGYINDDFQGGNVFFTEDPSNADSLLIVTRKRFQAGRVYELFIAYGREYWLQHGHLLPPDKLRQCMQYYKFSRDEMKERPAVSAKESVQESGTPVSGPRDEREYLPRGIDLEEPCDQTVVVIASPDSVRTAGAESPDTGSFAVVRKESGVDNINACTDPEERVVNDSDGTQGLAPGATDEPIEQIGVDKGIKRLEESNTGNSVAYAITDVSVEPVLESETSLLELTDNYSLPVRETEGERDTYAYNRSHDIMSCAGACDDVSITTDTTEEYSLEGQEHNENLPGVRVQKAAPRIGSDITEDLVVSVSGVVQGETPRPEQYCNIVEANLGSNSHDIVNVNDIINWEDGTMEAECEEDPGVEWVDSLLADTSKEEQDPYIVQTRQEEPHHQDALANTSSQDPSRLDGRDTSIVGEPSLNSVRTQCKGMIIVVGAPELSDTGLELEQSRADSTAVWRRESTQRTATFRKRLGEEWLVLTLYHDDWRKSQPEHYQTTCLDLEYTIDTGREIRALGYNLPIRHILFDTLDHSVGHIAKAYPHPLAAYKWNVGAYKQCVVWIPNALECTQVVRNTPYGLCKGKIVGGSDLLHTWCGCQQKPRIGSKRKPTISSVGIHWDGREESDRRDKWLVRINLSRGDHNPKLPAALLWRNAEGTQGNGSKPAEVSQGNQGNKCWEGLTMSAQQEGESMGTDVDQIRRLEYDRCSGKGVLPRKKGVPDPTISQHYGICSERGPPIERLKTGYGRGGVGTTRRVEILETLLIALGRAGQRPRKDSTMPQLPMGNGRWLSVSQIMWDVCLVKENAITLERHHEHLTPWLHFSSNRSVTNCHISHSETGHPIIVASRALEQGTQLICYNGESVIKEPSSEVQEVVPDTTEVVMDAAQTLTPVARSAPPGVKVKNNEKWLWLETPKKAPAHNLGLLCLNQDGRWRNINGLTKMICYLADHGAKSIDGVILNDTGVPHSKVTLLTAQYKKAFKGRNFYVEVLPAQPPCGREGSEDPVDFVGGATVIVFCKPGLEVVDVHQDPGQFGILTKVTLRVGRQHTIQWLGAYVPFANPNADSTRALENKVGAWHRRYRLPNTPAEEDLWQGDHFDAAQWTWHLIGTAVAKARGNKRCLGVILMGDLNQTLCTPTDTYPLEERTAELGLHHSLAERWFREKGYLYPTRNFFQAKPGRHIDHLYTTLLGEMLISGGSPTDPLWSALSDHLPIIGLFRIPEMSQRKKVKLPDSPSPVSFDLRKESDRVHIREVYEQEIKKIPNLKGPLPRDAEEIGQRLEFSCRAWADIAAKVHEKVYKKKAPLRYRPSAEHRALQVHYKYLDLLLKLICGYEGKRKAGSRSSIQDRWKQLRKKLSKWQAEEDKVWRNRDDRPACLDFGTGHPREWWVLKGLHEEPEITLPHDMKILQRQMKGALSREQSADFKKFEQKRKKDIAANKMKHIIQSTLGTRNPTPVFNQMESDEGWITDPLQIHKRFTDDWADRFRQPRTSGVAIAGLEPTVLPGESEYLPAAAQWEELLKDPDKFCDTFQNSGCPVPPDLVADIARAFSNNPNRQGLEQYLEQAFTEEFKLEDMKTLIKRSKSTTPGLTGFSYQMMKLLPDSEVNRLFLMMNRLWTNRSIPTFWTFKALQGIPKSDKPNPGVADLRPIGLIEVTRKLWTRMVMAKIFKGMRKFHVIQANQSGGLANRGTDSALLQLINLLEEGVVNDKEESTRELLPQIDYTSWDTRMAYDSVSNHVQYAAWRRLGIPLKEARWLMGLDMHGLFVVLSPYARHTLSKIKMVSPQEQAHHEVIRSIGFVPERGLTQGDVKSPLGWIAFFDILIRALNQCHPDQYPKYTVEAPELDTLLPSVYMDDLTSATCTRVHTQQVADLVSAFNALFGTEAATKKFRATSTHPVGAPIIIHDEQWQPTSKEFDGPLKVIRILGVDINLNLEWSEQSAELINKFKKIGKALRASSIEEEAKIKIINLAVITKASYVLGLAAWPPKVVQDLDAAITQMARHSLRLGKNYPGEIIHSKRFGFGVLKLSRHADQAKERSQNRCLEGPGPQNNAARGLANRAMCDQLGKLIQGQGEAIGTPPADNRYIAAVCSAGRRRKKRLKRVGRVVPPELRQVGAHPEILSQPQEVRKFVSSHGIHFLAECRNWLTGARAQWVETATEDDPQAQEILTGLDTLWGSTPLPSHIPIRQGHLLAFQDGSASTFFEVDGFIGRNQCLGGVWYQPDPAGNGYELLKMGTAPDQGRCGAGRCELTYAAEYCSGLAFVKKTPKMLRSHRASHDVYQLMGVNGTIEFDFLPPPARRRHAPPIAPWTEPILEAAAAFGRTIDCLTSDGSVEATHISPAELWAGPQAFLARRGAIVMTDKEWLQGKGEGLGPIGVVIISDFPDDLAGMSNGVELVSLTAELQVGDAQAQVTGSIPITETDCMSLIRRGEKEYSRYGKRSLDNRKHGFLYRYIRRIKRKWEGGVQRWIQSHPERRKGIGAFTSAEARITIADAFAGSEDPEEVCEMLTKPRMRNCKFELVPSHVHRVSAREVLESIFSPGDYCWVDESDFPLTASLMSQDTDDLHDYLDAREGYAKLGSKYTWKDSELGLLGHMWTKTRKSRNYAERKAMVQDIWDKRQHGRNQQKFWKLDSPLSVRCVT